MPILKAVSFLILFVSFVTGYEVPEAKLEAIYPKGLRVSIPGKLEFTHLSNIGCGN